MKVTAPLRRTLWLSFVAALLLLSSCAANIGPSRGTGRSGGGGSGITPAAAGKPQFPQNGTLLGASSYYANGANTMAQRVALMNQRDADAGRPYDVQNDFYRWDLPFPTEAEHEAINRGRSVMVSWNGTATSTILSGQSDDLIRTRARGLRDLHVPVLLRFFWEMDGHKGIDLAGTPANFIAAWRHVHQIFAQEGAANVGWVWSPTNLRFGGWYGTSGPDWYPGDDVVDWIGGDGYNNGGAGSSAPWDSFGTVFSGWYAWASTHNKPLMVAETGALERNPGEKAQWLYDMVTTMKTRYPRIKALVYFDLPYGDPLLNWEVNSSPSSYAAFNKIARDPYLNTRG